MLLQPRISNFCRTNFFFLIFFFTFHTKKYFLKKLFCLKSISTYHILQSFYFSIQIPIVTLRAIVAQHLQYFLCARISDLLRLRACDIAVTTLGDTPAMAITFRSSKTDPRYIPFFFLLNFFCKYLLHDYEIVFQIPNKYLLNKFCS